MSDEPKKSGGAKKNAAAKPKGAPTLYIIALLKIVKGAFLLLAAFSIYELAGHDLTNLFDQLLIRVHLDPERRFFVNVGEQLGSITPATMRKAELGTLIYGCILLGGGLGLAFRWHWAVWLAIGESAFFIPIELYELVSRRAPDAATTARAATVNLHPGLFHHPKIALLVVLAINIVIVGYLSIKRNTIFRHH
jgi:uncharacterized membrane protein (DUF2068 family)